MAYVDSTATANAQLMNELVTANNSINNVGNSGPQEKEVHVRFQQRTGRKGITTVQGLNQKLNFNKLNKQFKKQWGCAGIVIETEDVGKVIQLQGDQRQHLVEFITNEKLANKESIKVFGL